MHAEFVVPNLLAAHGPRRVPALERLLARGRASRGEAVALEAWLCLAFGLEHGEVPAGALTLLADGGDPGDGLWVRADPVHVRLEGGAPVQVPGTALGITTAEAQALAQSLNRQLGDRIEFHARRPERWCARCDRADGPASTRWDPLLTEVQMVLHADPVNAAREWPVNSVQFWGAGVMPRAARGPWQSVCADEPVAAGLARLARVPHRALPAGAAQWLAQMPAEGRHLLVLDAPRTADVLDELEERWFAPLLEALRRDRVGMITLSVPDAGLAFETIRGDLRRFWRRARPLGAYA